MNSRPSFCRLVIAVLAMGAGQTVYADLGRLFFSESEREALERARMQAAIPPVVELQEPEPELVPELTEQGAPDIRPGITVDGYVRRSNGSATLWINGQNSYDGDLAASRVDPRSAAIEGRRVRLKPLDDNTSILLKPGQSYDPNAGTTVDGYDTPQDPAVY